MGTRRWSSCLSDSSTHLERKADTDPRQQPLRATPGSLCLQPHSPPGQPGCRLPSPASSWHPSPFYAVHSERAAASATAVYLRPVRSGSAATWGLRTVWGSKRQHLVCSVGQTRSFRRHQRSNRLSRLFVCLIPKALWQTERRRGRIGSGSCVWG